MKIEMLERNIKLLLTDSNLRNTIAETSFEYAQKFNDENIQTKLMNVYEKLIRTKSTKSEELDFV
jgi:hypothetical protein